MKIFMTGATGLVGSALALRLARDGHEVIAWVRGVQSARQVLGPEVKLVPIKPGHEGDLALQAALAGVDAVVNLAGAPVAQRWTAHHRQRLIESRVGLTQRLVQAMRAQEHRPQVMVSASAVGYYGDQGSTKLDEQSARGHGFLADLCEDWEQASRQAESLGVRVAMLRIGIVLAGHGGALAAMRPAFSLGLGAVLGSGQQYMPFIHLHDLLQLFMAALDDDRYDGVFNATAPNPVDNRHFTKAIARALKRPALLRAPGWALKLGMGSMASVVLTSQRAIPQRALALGFRFRFEDLDAALSDVLNGGKQSVQIGPASEVPDAPYLAQRRPRYLLEQTTLINAPLPQVFDFFRKAENLGVITPPDLAFELRTPSPIPMHEGAEIRYRIRLGPVPMPWLTKIVSWEPNARFVDAQLQGPYRCWYHEHRFIAEGERTRMIDRVWYAPPLGPVGWVANALMVAPMLRKIFGFRSVAIARRFGVVDEGRGQGGGGSSSTMAA